MIDQYIMKEINGATQEDLTAVIRLTALWGLAESGLGGIMFAFKIPLTGFLIGAVSIVLLSLIARHSAYSYRQIISATIIVVMVKAAASPHSPPAAYFAVSFQGVIAALLFSTMRSHKLACVLLGILSMAESSLQKVIVLTILFGKSVWEATNSLGREVAKNFSLDTDHNYALWIIGGYVLIYMLWGAVVGFFAAGAPARIQRQKQRIIKDYNKVKAERPIIAPEAMRRSRTKRWIIYTGMLAFIIIVFILFGANSKRVTAIILRTVAVVLLLVFVAQPLLKFIFNKWLSRRTRTEQERSREALEMLPALKSLVPDAYTITKTDAGFFNRLSSFLLVMIILTLYAGQEEQHHPI